MCMSAVPFCSFLFIIIVIIVANEVKIFLVDLCELFALPLLLSPSPSLASGAQGFARARSLTEDERIV